MHLVLQILWYVSSNTPVILPVLTRSAFSAISLSKDSLHSVNIFWLMTMVSQNRRPSGRDLRHCCATWLTSVILQMEGMDGCNEKKTSVANSKQMIEHWKLSYNIFTHAFNSLAPGKFERNFRYQVCNFQTDFIDWWWRHLLRNCPNMNVTGLHWWSVNIGSGNGLVPSGNKPLPEPMLTQISVTICHH